jgi:hypothetical protein
MRKSVIVLALIAMSVVVAFAPAAADVVEVESCQAGPVGAATPGTPLQCTVGPIVCFEDCTYVANVRVDGVGLVGASVTTSHGPTVAVGDPPEPVRSTGRCGPVLGDCEATASGKAEAGGFVGSRVTAVCKWTGVLALNASLACDLTVVEAGGGGGIIIN